MDRIGFGALTTLAAASIFAIAALTLSMLTVATMPAHAADYCGYAAKSDAVIECGYTTVADCETAVGKGGMCFVDPEMALNIEPAEPLSRHAGAPPASHSRPPTGRG